MEWMKRWECHTLHTCLTLFVSEAFFYFLLLGGLLELLKVSRSSQGRTTSFSGGTEAYRVPIVAESFSNSSKDDISILQCRYGYKLIKIRLCFIC